MEVIAGTVTADFSEDDNWGDYCPTLDEIQEKDGSRLSSLTTHIDCLFPMGRN